MQIGWVSGEINVTGQPTRFFDETIDEEDVELARDELERVLGDKEAKVTTSLNMNDKNFGNGFGAMVSVTLTCGQERRSMDEANALALDLTASYLSDAFKTAQELYEAHHES
jgi:hypothetical protein